MSNYSELLAILENDLNNAKNEKQAIEIKNIFSKKHVAPLYKELGKAEDKRAFGQALNELKKNIDDMLEQKIASLNQAFDALSSDELIDLSLDNPFLNVGNEHLLNIVLNDTINFFKTLNFDIVSGNEVVTDEYNFQRLNIPENHPARNMQDSFFINTEYMLRTHCTVTTAQNIANNQNNDIRVLSYGNVYRKDDDDATHSHQFTQIDFVWIRENLNLANLKWVIDSFIKYLFGEESKTRYRLSFFPFTEPSFEVDVTCFKCHGHGCNICKKTGWIEVLGAGMLHENVLSAANIHGKKGIAGGIGIERLAMLKYGISDIRNLYNNNFAVNKQFKK
ncbi:phenylalanine--tRNA ligase subunit alpha [Ureaplasma ceti]|uniref:Phenylalanine--tRNA ligase alpha subunit n=1 Tax=Ureaplasma ceti TaxID=3119530 RepID=A0ABP9UAP8_9BACT